MKTTLSILLSVSLIVVSGSCHKKQNSPAPAPVPSYSMSAILSSHAGDSTAFVASGAGAVTAVLNGSRCTISATGITGSTPSSNFTFVITNYNGKGYYSFGNGSTSSNPVYQTGDTAFAQTPFSNAVLIITDISGETITGTFSGTLVDTVSVVNGNFVASGTGF